MLKKVLITLIYVLFFLCLNIDAYSTDLKVFLDKRKVEINKTLLLTIEVSQDVKSIELPKITDFVVILKENYKKKNKRIYEYEFAPKAVGFFTIPSIVVGDTSSIPISVEVYDSNNKEKKSLNRDSSSFTQAYMDTRIVYVNQLVYYTLSFRTKRDLANNPTYTLPLFQNFWKNKSKVESGYKLINGDNYFTFDVITSLYPMKEGDLIIDPSSVSIQYLNSSDIKKFESNKVKIKILSLPSLGKPDNFSGAVGQYEISAIVNKKNVKINEPFVLNITIKGNGNINSVVEPNIVLPSEMKKYATTIKINKEGIINSKQFKCVIIPMIEGILTVPKISFSYFNPDLKEYITTSTNEFKINVSGKKQDDSEIDSIQDVVDNNDKDLKKLEIDLSIKNNIDLSKTFESLIVNKFLILLVVLVILSMIISVLYRIKLFYLYKDVDKVRKMIARKEFINCMHKATKALQNNKQFDFYSNIDIAIRMLLKSKNNFEYCFMIREKIIGNLKSINVDDKLIDIIIEIFNKCDKFKFTNMVSSNSEMKQVCSKVNFIKDELDKIIL